MQYPVRWSAQSPLHFTPWQTCSFRHQLVFSWKQSAVPAIIAQRLFSHILTFAKSQILILYSWLNWGISGENKNIQSSKQQQRRFEPRLSWLRVRHSTAELPCSTIILEALYCWVLHNYSFTPWCFERAANDDDVTSTVQVQSSVWCDVYWVEESV